MMTAADILVSGQVQGVGYRYYTVRQAEHYGLTGFVRNLADGRVAVFVEGEKVLIEQFKQELEKGPRFANVDKVEINFSLFKAKFKKFVVDY